MRRPRASIRSHLRLVASAHGTTPGRPSGLIVAMCESPLVIFFAWLDALGPVLADELAMLVATIAPRPVCGDVVPSRVDVAHLRARLRACATSIGEEVGTVLMVAGFVELLLREAPRRVGTDALSARRWARAARSWQALRAERLSDEALAAQLDFVLAF